MPSFSFDQRAWSAPDVPAKILYWRQDNDVQTSTTEGFSHVSVVSVSQRIQFLHASGFVHATKIIRNGILDNLHIRTQCPDGSTYTMNKGDVQQVVRGVFQVPGNYFLFWNYKFTALGVKIGCIVDFHYVVSYPRFRRYDRLPLTHALPIQNARFTFSNLLSPLPYYPAFIGLTGLWWRISATQKKPRTSSEPAFARLRREDKLRALQKHVSYQMDPDNRRLVIQLNQIPPLHLPASTVSKSNQTRLPDAYQSPSYVLMAPSLKGQSDGWRTTEAFFHKKLFRIDEKDRDVVGELPEIARRLTAGVTSRAQKIRLLQQHIQSRFQISTQEALTKKALWKGYQQRFGNGYVAAMSLIVMLRAVGIRAYPALLVPGGREIPDHSPSPLLFKNILVYIAPNKAGPLRGKRHKVQAARGLPKRPKAPAGIRFLSPKATVLPPSWFGRWAFFIDGHGGGLLRLPRMDPRTNSHDVKLKLTIASNGSVQVWLRSSSEGPMGAAQQRYAKNRKETRPMGSSLIDKACGRPGQHKGFKVIPGKRLDWYRYELRFAGRYCQISYGQKRLMFRALPLWLFRVPSLPKAAAGERLAPLSLGIPRSLSWHVQIQLPPGYRWSKQRRWAGAIPGIHGHVSVKASQGGSKIVLQARMVITKHAIPAKAYPKVYDFLQQFQRHAQHPIQLKQEEP